MIGVDEMDEEIEGGLAAADVADATGGLSVYKDPNVQSAVAERNKLNNEYKKYYDDLTAKIMAQRTGPSFSERMFQLSAALAQPTSRRGFGAVLENVAPVLQAQERAQREGMDKRRDALSALKAAQLGQRVGLANQDVTTALAMAKINNRSPVGIEVNGVLVDRATNKPIGAAYNNTFNSSADEAAAYAKLEAEPTEANLKVLVDYYPRYETQFIAAYRRGLSRSGKGTN